MLEGWASVSTLLLSHPFSPRWSQGASARFRTKKGTIFAEGGWASVSTALLLTPVHQRIWILISPSSRLFMIWLRVALWPCPPGHAESEVGLCAPCLFHEQMGHHRYEPQPQSDEHAHQDNDG
jgi:hypothetical protein